MLFSTFSSYLDKLGKTASRNQMTEILAKLFKKSTPGEIDKVCYLSLGMLAPKYEGLEFNMAEKIMIKAIARSLDLEEKKITQEFKNRGDLGDIVEALRQRETGNNKLSVLEVYDRLLGIAQEEGEGSVERKIGRMARLLKELNSSAAKYVARIPVNKLRLGFSDMTILDALSWMEKKDKSLRPQLERAFNVLADTGRIASVFKAEGMAGLEKIRSEVGVPIRAARAERLPNPEKILEKMEGKCVLEPKYDGFRVQIHLDKTRKFKIKEEKELALFKDKGYFVRIFSRNLDNMTYMFPDVVETVQHLAVEKVILDGEAIGFDPKTGKFLPFQETVQRKRKYGIGKKIQEVPLRVFVFDILYLDGKSLLEKPFKERRQILEKVLKQSKGEEEKIVLTEQRIVSQPAAFENFFKDSVEEGLEGLMAKKLDTPYQAGARNYNWVKYKVGMKSELADTIDCVVLGFYKGKGKRVGFGMGAFLVGIVDKDKFLTVSKIGTGLTDKQWQEMYKKCQKAKGGRQQKPKEYQVDKNLYPDVWCTPEIVVEIEADTITKSPIHTAGLALRFPRLKRFRDDKDPSQATSLAELKQLVRVKK